MKNLRMLDKWRALDVEREVSPVGNPEPHNLGCFRIPYKGVTLKIMASSGGGWDHVSVSPLNHERCPTWEEMEFLKREFFDPDDVVMQLHVAEKDHINNHPFCLHLWRPMYQEIPIPPSSLVGKGREIECPACGSSYDRCRREWKNKRQCCPQCTHRATVEYFT